MNRRPAVLEFTHLDTSALSLAVTSNPNCCSFKQNEIRAIKTGLLLLMATMMALHVVADRTHSPGRPPP